MQKLMTIPGIKYSGLIGMIAILQACSGLEYQSPQDVEQQFNILLQYQQDVRDLNETELAAEADLLRDKLARQETPAPAVRLQLNIVEEQLAHLNMLGEERQQQRALRGEIQSLREQIEALTAIEQQINRRGQRQESNASE